MPAFAPVLRSLFDVVVVLGLGLVTGLERGSVVLAGYAGVLVQVVEDAGCLVAVLAAGLERSLGVLAGSAVVLVDVVEDAGCLVAVLAAGRIVLVGSPAESRRKRPMPVSQQSVV